MLSRSQNHILHQLILNTQKEINIGCSKVDVELSPLKYWSLPNYYEALKAQKHPVLDTIKQVLSWNTDWGSLVMTFSKLTDNPNYKAVGNKNGNLLQKQQKLAHVTEYIRLSHKFHRSIMCGPTKQLNDSNGDKVAILTGSWMLCRAHFMLAEIMNSEVYYLMMKAVRDLTEGEFFEIEPSIAAECIENKTGTFDGAFIPVMWEECSVLKGADLLGTSYKSLAILAGLDEEIQHHAYEHGRNFILALKSFSELQQFLSDKTRRQPLDVLTLPTLLHLQYSPSLYEKVEDVELRKELDFSTIRTQILDSPALLDTRKLIREYVKKSAEHLEVFPDKKERQFLYTILSLLKGL